MITSILLILTPPLDPALSVAWTLMHELLFYVFFGLIYISRKIFFATFTLWGMMILFFSFKFLGSETLIGFLLEPRNLQFMLGIIAALVVKDGKANVACLFTGLVMVIIFIFGLNSEAVQYENYDSVEAIYLGACFMLIVIGLCSIESKVKYPKVLSFMGTASYSIYLVHNPMISVLNRVAGRVTYYLPLQPEFFFMLISSLSLCSGCLYYLLWEKPTLKLLKNRYIRT